MTLLASGWSSGHPGLSLTGPDPSSAVPMVLAQPSPTPQEPGGRGEEFGKSSPLGLLVLILFFVAVAFLIRSMTKHLKRVPPSFDEPNGDNSEGTDTPKPNGNPKPA